MKYCLQLILTYKSHIKVIIKGTWALSMFLWDAVLIAGKCKRWTLDLTVDWTMDCIMDWELTMCMRINWEASVATGYLLYLSWWLVVVENQRWSWFHPTQDSDSTEIITDCDSILTFIPTKRQVTRVVRRWLDHGWHNHFFIIVPFSFFCVHTGL